jgi:outer membrane protein OmpA-like peptidoglycan-associated protein
MKIIIFFLLALSLAQAGSLNLIGHRFTDSSRYSLLADTLLEKHQNQNIFFGSYGYVKSPLYVTDINSNRLTDVINYNHAFIFGFTRYVKENLAIGFDTAAVNNKVLGERKSALADTNVKGRWNFLNAWANYSLNTNLILPTGSMKNYTSAGGPGISFSLAGEKKFNRLSVLASVGYQYADNQVLNEIDYHELLLSQLGVSFDLSKYWVLNFETYRNFTFNNSDNLDEGDYFLTFRHAHRSGIHMYGGAGVAAAKLPERNNITLFAGLKYAFGDAEKVAPQVITRYVPVLKSRDDEKLLGILLKEDNVYFGNASTDITPVQMVKINNVVKMYAENKLRLLHIVIEGYASKRGDEKRNLELSAKRSAAVKNELVKSNVPEDIISIVGYGENSIQEADEAKNRKVQFRVYLREGTL